MTSLSIKPSQAEATAPRAKPPLSRWWPIGLFCVWPVLIAASILLIAIGVSQPSDLSGPAYANILMGGYVCLGFGLAVKSAFWVLMIVRYRQVRCLPAPPVERPLSRWWAIGLFWPAFGLTVAGATLFGLGISLFDYFDTRVPKEPYYSEMCGGLACLAIGLVLMMASWVAVVIRHREWKRAQHAVPPVGMPVNGGVYAATPASGQQIANIHPPAHAPSATQQHSSLNTAELSGQGESLSTAELTAQHQQEPTPNTTGLFGPQPGPSAAELSEQRQPSPNTAELSRQQPPTQNIAELSEQRQLLAHTTAELSGQQLLELASTSTTATIQPPHAVAEFPAEYIPHQYATIVQTPPGPPTPKAAELPTLASPAELPGPQPLPDPTTSSSPFHPFSQHLFSAQKEVAPSTGRKEPVAKFCRYCGSALDASTKLCGSCGS